METYTPLMIVILAIALGMDALSASLGFAQQKIRKNDVILLGITVGIMHVIMPLLGMTVGKYFSEIFGQIASTFSGLLLIFLGARMVISLVKGNDDREEEAAPLGMGIVLFALGVSLDSFSVGLSLGLIGGAEVAFTLTMFGIVAALMTWLGLILGRIFHNALGKYSEAIGAGILIIFGVRIILG